MPIQPPSPHTRRDAVLVGFAGRIGAGKTSAAEYLRQNHGFQYARYSQIIREWLHWDTAGRQRLQEFGWELMASERQVELNARLIASLRRSRSAAIDGLRHRIDYESLTCAFGRSFKLIFIEAPKEFRFNRVRNEFGSSCAFDAADSHPVEAQIDSLKAVANTTITNDERLATLYRQLDLWLASSEFKEHA